MLIQQQPAYILHARPWRETSLLLECLTREHGRVGMVARGVRRPRARLSQSQLQPFQSLQVSFVLRGELATLRGAEAEGRPLALEGAGLLSGLYVNELVVRLSERQDPYPALFPLYRQTLQRLAGAESPAWTLRRFERDFLRELGYAMQLEHDADNSEPLRSDGAYLYVPEHGPVAAERGVSGMRVLGGDLQALAGDRMPDAAAMGRLRRLSRGLLHHHLGGIPLRSWSVLTGLPRPPLS